MDFEVGKKYKTRDGDVLKVIYIMENTIEPVVAICEEHKSVRFNRIHRFSAKGIFLNDTRGCTDLVEEYNEYSDWNIDDKILVSDDGIDWLKRHFAGVTEDGKPLAFDGGCTSWSADDSINDINAWCYTKKATDETR